MLPAGGSRWIVKALRVTKPARALADAALSVWRVAVPPVPSAFGWMSKMMLSGWAASATPLTPWN